MNENNEKYVAMFLDEECIEVVIKALDNKVNEYIKNHERRKATNLLNNLITLEENLMRQEVDDVEEN